MSTVTASMTALLSMLRSSTSRKKEAFLLMGPLRLPPNSFKSEGSLLGRIRIAGIEDIVAVVEIGLPAQFVGAGLGQNLDAAEADLVVFRRKRVLIDADLADGIFVGKLAAGEPVDVNLAAVGACRRTRQSLQIGLQIVGIVGKRLQIFAAQDQAPALLDGSVLTVGPVSDCTVTSCFSSATRS